MTSNTLRHLRLLTRLSQVTLALLVITISYLAFSDQSGSTVISYSDKLNHLMAFFTLSIFLDYSLPKNTFDRTKIVLLLLYGASIEIIQEIIPYRECSLLDLIVDSAGILVYALLSPVIMKLPLLKQRKSIIQVK